MKNWKKVLYVTSMMFVAFVYLAASFAALRILNYPDKPVEKIENTCTAQPDKPEKITITITTTCR